MAASASSSPSWIISLQNQVIKTCSTMLMSRSLTVNGKIRKSNKNRGLSVIGGCGCGGVGGGFYEISEEDVRFVDAFREAQTYVHLYRGSTFVVILSAEIVAGPSFDAILKI
ncbi:hypothetical protein LWI29_009781 [Acer saccharum]|uniref:Uncharacterized protein n=1 Tax=Acer saccharum TaxID=4024 RepID=A0AA39SS70_ACESA|nr:hypothetical protein LWI29_009781 [Acer saccharum]